jgi:hypothetical protein
MLNEQQVVEIYMAKLALRAHSRNNAPGTNKMQGIKGQSGHVSAMYGVTSRTIRDIWNRQSWAYATRHLWNLESQLRVDNMLSTEHDMLSMHTAKVQLHPIDRFFAARLMES